MLCYFKIMARQWSMHAEVQITNNAQNETNQPITYTEQDGNVVRMVYTWSSNPEKQTTKPEPKPNFGFQRGNMMFTSTPPRTERTVQDSGYNSDHIPPNYRPGTSRTYMPYDRRCKSTCSITLSTDINVPVSPKFCGRSESLHYPKQVETKACRTQSLHYPRQNYQRFSPVYENCEDCKCENPFSTHFCTKLKEKNNVSNTKDMTTQTVETKEKGTSPIENIEFFSDKNENFQNKKEFFEDTKEFSQNKKDVLNEKVLNKEKVSSVDKIQTSKEVSPQKEYNTENRSDSELQKARKKDVRKSSNRKKRNHISKKNNDSFENPELLNPQDLEISVSIIFYPKNVT